MNIREVIYTMPFAGMKQIVRRSLISNSKGTFIYIEIRPQVSNDPDYAQYEVWHKSKNFRLGDVEVTKFSEQQTSIAFQIESSIEGDDRSFLDLFVEFFFDKVEDLRKGIEQLQKAQSAIGAVQVGEPLHPIDAALKWYDEERAAGRKVTLQDVADRTGFDLSTVKKRSAARHKNQEPK